MISLVDLGEAPLPNLLLSDEVSNTPFGRLGAARHVRCHGCSSRAYDYGKTRVSDVVSCTRCWLMTEREVNCRNDGEGRGLNRSLGRDNCRAVAACALNVGWLIKAVRQVSDRAGGRVQRLTESGAREGPSVSEGLGGGQDTMGGCVL